MKNIEDLLRTYSKAYRISIALTDPQGNLLLDPVWDSPFSEWFYHQFILTNPEIINVENADLWETNEPIIIDCEDSGLSTTVIPLVVNSQEKMLLWTGPVVYEWTEETLRRYLERFDCVVDTGMDLFKKYAPFGGDKMLLTIVTEELSSVLSRILKYEYVGNQQQRYALQMDALFETITKTGVDVESILTSMLHASDDLQFTAYAVKTDTNRFVIKHTAGADQLQNQQILAGEGYLGQSILLNRAGTWECRANDPRAKLFTQHGIPIPEAIYCFPVQVNQSVTGLIFGGGYKNEKNWIESFGKCFARLYGLHLSHQSITSELEYQMMRMTALVEVATAITSIKDVKRILYLLVDMSLYLFRDAKASMFMLQADREEKIEIVTRGFSSEIAGILSKHLANHYLYGLNSDAALDLSEFDKEHSYCMACPVIIHNQVRGVFCVEHSKTNEEGDFLLPLMHLLSLAGGRSLEQTTHFSKYTDQHIIMLFEAMGHWEQDKYLLASRLTQLANEYGRYAKWADYEVRLLADACMLMYYPLELLRQLHVDSNVVQVMMDYHKLSSGGHGHYSKASQTLFLLHDYCQTNSVSVQKDTLEPHLLDSFYRFTVHHESSRLQIELTIDHADPGEQIPSIKLDIHEGSFTRHPKIKTLSPREMQVLQQIVLGSSNREIAGLLSISEHTVKNHITNIFNKMAVSDRIQLMRLFIQS